MISFPAVWTATAAVFMPTAAGFPNTFLIDLLCSSHISLLKTPQQEEPFSGERINNEEMWCDPCDAPNWISTL
jgi:hypothetical protein